MQIRFSGFPEIENLLGHCQFRNCTHTHEKHCALREAAKNGEILPRRLESYLRLQDEIAEAQQKLVLLRFSKAHPLKG